MEGHSAFLSPSRNKNKWEKRELVNAVLYLVDNGCKWHSLPHDFPPYTTVSNFYHAAVKSGLWENLLTALVNITCEEDNRKAAPSYGIIDSQSLKTTGAAEERGIDGGKKQKDASGIL
ncbi:MAG: transposase [Clostridiales bacterium]|nr:transposase [Clostridiales bacterium]